MESKRALVILTNEAFIPKCGRGGHREQPGSNYEMMATPGKQPVVMSSPSSWTPNITSVHSPTVDPNEEIFAKMHHKTGVDILEVGYFWTHFFRENRIELTFASPRGGAVALDPLSIDSVEKDDRLKNRLKEDREFMMKLGHTYPISWVDLEEFDIVLVPGCHGALFDLSEHPDVAKAITTVYNRGGYICCIGHGCAALINAKASPHYPSTTPNPTEYLIKNKKITCYTNEEEKQKRYEEYLPFMLEDKLEERGAKVEHGKPFQSFVITDERLITAQSWPSIQEFVKKITEKISK
jgi:putative intracellular protease/amidase